MNDTIDQKLETCTLKKFNPLTGVECSLTSAKPNFKITCPDFKKDTEKLQASIRESESKFRANFDFFDFIKDLIYKKRILAEEVQIKHSSLTLLVYYSNLSRNKKGHYKLELS